MRKLFLEKFHDFIAEAVKAFVPYFEVLQDGFVKRPCDADLVIEKQITFIQTKKWTKTYIETSICIRR